MKPAVRVLLDVDGVINAVTSDPGDHWDDWNSATCRGFRITYSWKATEILRQLAVIPEVELLWLTTWGESANEWIAPLVGLSDLDVAGEPPWRQPNRWWKADIAIDLYERDLVPFVWIDDDIDGPFDDGAAAWVRTLDGEGLAIRPDSHKGLTPRLVSEIATFVNIRLEAAGSSHRLTIPTPIS